jgi:hypothetical protein
MNKKDHIVSNPPQPNVEDTSMATLHALTLTKQEWTIIFNVLVRTQYGLGDASLVAPIVGKIQPLVAQLSDKDIKSKEKVGIN